LVTNDTAGTSTEDHTAMMTLDRLAWWRDAPLDPEDKEIALMAKELLAARRVIVAFRPYPRIENECDSPFTRLEALERVCKALADYDEIIGAKDGTD